MKTGSAPFYYLREGSLFLFRFFFLFFVIVFPAGSPRDGFGRTLACVYLLMLFSRLFKSKEMEKKDPTETKHEAKRRVLGVG